MFGVVLICEGEFGDEVCQSLCFNGCSGVVFNVELTKLDCPLNHSSCRFRFVHGLSNGLVCHYQDGIFLEILP